MLEIVRQSVALPAPPGELYAMYLDPVWHAAFTGGGPVEIAAVEGSAWRAFDGRIHGRILALSPGRRIVQSWRSFEWEDGDPDAVLVLAFRPAGIGAMVELAQVDVPPRLSETLKSGWPARYWDPWRAYLERRPPGKASGRAES